MYTCNMDAPVCGDTRKMNMGELKVNAPLMMMIINSEGTRGIVHLKSDDITQLNSMCEKSG